MYHVLKQHQTRVLNIKNMNKRNVTWHLRLSVTHSLEMGTNYNVHNNNNNPWTGFDACCQITDSHQAVTRGQILAAVLREWVRWEGRSHNTLRRVMMLPGDVNIFPADSQAHLQGCVSNCTESTIWQCVLPFFCNSISFQKSSHRHWQLLRRAETTVSWDPRWVIDCPLLSSAII